MSSLSDIDKRYLEKLLRMSSGWVLDYSDATYGAFFRGYGVDIHGPKYERYGTSKSKKMRAFWESEPDQLVGQVLSGLLASYQADCDLNAKEVDSTLLAKGKEIVTRLSGEHRKAFSATVNDFLSQEFTITNTDRLPIETQVLGIIESRISEATVALRAGAFLSVIVLCGSVLEAVLLGAAQKEPARFNRASCSAKASDGSVKRFQEWSLSQFIDVACELDLLKPDVKHFSHGLRNFRNYIHPYEQMMSGFSPDEHTAKVCFQVLKAALASVAGDRK